MASRAVVEGAVETMTEKQSEAIGQQKPCPTWGRVRELKRKGKPTHSVVILLVRNAG